MKTFPLRECARPARARATRPSLEALEGRLLLYATLGAQWSKPIRITYSLVPDGTSVGGTPSNLFQTLDAVAPTATWQRAIQTAAAIWEAVAGINLVQVSDSGDPIGVSGYQQGDSRFGDIRIGGIPQSGTQLAFAYAPPPINGGTNAGDFFFNTAQSWQVDGTTFDLETVAIHEFAHALGMAHSAILVADMYAYYIGAKHGIASDDTAGIQSIYGVPPVDSYEYMANNKTDNNNSPDVASPISGFLNSSGQAILTNARISDPGDVDWYYVVAPTNTTTNLTVQAVATNFSSSSPQVQVYTGTPLNLTLVGQGSAPYSFGGTATATISGVTPGTGYYIKVLGADPGYSGAGTYALTANFSALALPLIRINKVTVLAQPDQNPTASADGTGWLINGRFIPFKGTSDNTLFSNGNGDGIGIGNGHGLGNRKGISNGDGLTKIINGSLSGYGDTLMIGQVTHGSHPHGPAQFRKNRPGGHHA